MRILVTGSREWQDRDGIHRVLGSHWARCQEASAPLTLVHGACPRGADRWADEWGRTTGGVTVERHYPDWARNRRNAGHIRNQAMVDLGADLVIACPWPGAANAGTSDCMRRAVRAGLHVVVLPATVRD